MRGVRWYWSAIACCVLWSPLKSHAESKWAIDPVILWGHTSALTRGEPLNPEQDELTIDRIELGWTFRSPGQKLEIDVSHGRKWWDSTDEQSTSLTVRWYPWRKIGR